MIKYIEEDIKEVMEITGLDKVKAEKLFKSVAKDIDDGSDDEICSYDVKHLYCFTRINMICTCSFIH